MSSHASAPDRPASKTATPPQPHGAPDRIGRDDARYADLVRRGFNKRFTATPDCVRLVRSTDQVIEAVQDAVRDGLRVVVRSGGHCMDGLVADPDVRVLIDTSLMTGVDYDPAMAAFVVEAGATMGEVHRRLFLGWGVMLPAGESPDIGAGGHILGGAFGFFCREHGLAADHLYGVEVVVVDADGTARRVVATREASDPHHDLWWAHTGAGGGNFGIVTRYWLRSPGVDGTDPSRALPAAPASVVTLRASWRWSACDRAAFTTLVRNHGDWIARHAGVDSPHARQYSMLLLGRQQAGAISMIGVSTAGDYAQRLFEEQLAAMNAGVGAPCTQTIERSSWLAFVLNPFPELFAAGKESARFKAKDAFLRKPLTAAQIGLVYDYLTRSDYDLMGGAMGIATYGGKVNTVPPQAAASAQRDAIADLACTVGWGDPKDEPRALAWVRAFYADLFAGTGGVPVPGDQTDGAVINHPDADLADPALNRSGVPWHTLYYKESYPRLQQVKARWDPRNVFRHALSIRVSARARRGHAAPSRGPITRCRHAKNVA